MQPLDARLSRYPAHSFWQLSSYPKIMEALQRASSSMALREYMQVRRHKRF